MKDWQKVYINSSSRKGTIRPDLSERNRKTAKLKKEKGIKPWNFGAPNLLTAYSNLIRWVRYWGA